MNPYLKNLNKIEFVLTHACTGRCKHCSQGTHASVSEQIDPKVATDAVRKIATRYNIETVMTFGGEPLLCTDAVCSIIKSATDLGIPRRQIITNGYFSKDASKVRDVARMLAECGVNDLLLSVDAFHQETIPLDTVKLFAKEVKSNGIPIRLSPAWLVSVTDQNPYNLKTREILDSFASIDIPVGEGNTVFPEGNAHVFLSEYFTDTAPKNPYIEDPTDVRCVSFSPNGDVLGGNVYKQDIMEILENYKP